MDQITRRKLLRATIVAALISSGGFGCGGGGGDDVPPPGRVEYDVVHLAPLTGDFDSGPTDMNEAGDVVGSSTGSEGPCATLWKAGEPSRPVFLGTLGTGDHSIATGINRAGRVTGHSATNGPAVSLGFRWADNAITALPVTSETAQALPQAIGADGRIAGTLLTRGASAPRGVVWEPGGAMGEIPALPGSAFALPQAIDAAGRIVGQTQTAAGVNAVHRAFVFENGQIRALPPLAGGGISSARSIGENGWVVGWSRLPNASRIRATVWRNDVPTDLGTLPGHDESAAYDVNARGEIVGFSGSDATSRRAFLWKNGTMRDLNGLIAPGTGWTLTTATATNDGGKIVGYGLIGGQSRAFLLIPRS